MFLLLHKTEAQLRLSVNNQNTNHINNVYDKCQLYFLIFLLLHKTEVQLRSSVNNQNTNHINNVYDKCQLYF